MRSKKTKRVIAVILAVVAAAGLGTGAFFIIKNSGKAVNVYPLADIAQTDMWMDKAQYEGNVRAQNLQTVYLSDTQQLGEVFVEEGDAVKKGDKLASFDTTLSDLELKRQQIEVQKTELSLSTKQAELKRINSLKPYVAPTPAPEPEPQPLLPEELPKLLGGIGTSEDPFVYLWNESCEFDDAFFERILPIEEAIPDAPEEDEETEGDGEDTQEQTEDDVPVIAEKSATVVFRVREYDNPAGELTYSWGMVFDRHADGSLSFTVFEPDGSYEPEVVETAEPVEADAEPEGGYSASEIAQMRAEKQREIQETQTELKVQKLKLKRLELEIDTGVVTASMDGVVKSVVGEEEARSENKPLITLSDGGAWFVTAYVGELDLEELSPGDEAEIQSWMGDYGVYGGKVAEISQTPVDSGRYGGNGNPNVSYYPVTVEVDESASLQEGDYVSVTFGSASGDTGLYLEKPFILEENGRSYVYVMDEDGRLEKREVGAGRIYWGSTVQITSGLTLDEYIAFPYGKDVKAGAKAEISDLSALYSYY